MLRYFDEKEQETTLQCYASEKGRGACLMQKGQPVQYASRALTHTEQNYAQIEKEMLAISFGLDRFEKYVYGRHIVVETDHLPLVTIHKKSLLSSPKRLQRMLLKTQMYDYTVIYKKGVEMYLAAIALSRAFHPVAEENKTTTEHIFLTDVEKEIEEINMVDYVSVSAKCLTELQTATKSDKLLCRLMKIIMSGWPDDKKRLRDDLKSYYTFRDELSVQDGLVFKGYRIVVPTSMQTEIKDRLNSSHVGVQGCLRRARETVYWPNMNADIEDYIGRCPTCNSIQRSQAKEPMIAHAIPELPWQHVACDLFECDGADYVVLVDYYSEFFEVDRLSDKRSNEVVRKLKAHFARHGCPETLCSDNGAPFNSKDFANFAEDFGFEHITSSPRYPRSNGKSESAVKAAKTLMMTSKDAKTDPYLALLELRNVPTGVFSRAEIIRKTYENETSHCEAVTEARNVYTRGRETAREEGMTNVLLRQGREGTKTSRKGQVVRFRPPGYRKWKKAVVDDQTDVRSYSIRTEDGRRYRRNRSHLRTTTESLGETTQQLLEQQQHPPTEYPSFNNEDNANVAASTTITVRETVCTPVQRPDARIQRNDARSPPRQRVSGRILNKPNFPKDYVQ